MILVKENVEKVANTEEQINKLKAAGFKELQANEPAGTSKTEKPVEEMNVKELREIAKEKGISGYSSLAKEELVELLKDVVE